MSLSQNQPAMHRLLLASVLLLSLLGTAYSAACDLTTCVGSITNIQAYCTCLTSEIASCTGDSTTLQGAVNTYGCDGCRLFTSLPLIIGSFLLLLLARY